MLELFLLRTVPSDSILPIFVLFSLRTVPSDSTFPIFELLALRIVPSESILPICALLRLRMVPFDSIFYPPANCFCCESRRRSWCCQSADYCFRATSAHWFVAALQSMPSGTPQGCTSFFSCLFTFTLKIFITLLNCLILVYPSLFYVNEHVNKSPIFNDAKLHRGRDAVNK